MTRPLLEVADIFRNHGPAWRHHNAGHISLGQLKVMSAIEHCRSATLGGHVLRCTDCARVQIAYLSRYTHRVAIANSRLIALDERSVTFRWKDYRAKGRTRHKTMTLEADEFIRRLLLHVLPSRFHRIRHYGLIANTGRRSNMALVRELLTQAGIVKNDTAIPINEGMSNAGDQQVAAQATFVCPDCGAPMVIIDTFDYGQLPRAPPGLNGDRP